MDIPKWLKMYYAIGLLPILFCTLLTYGEKASIFTIPVELVMMYIHYYFFHRFMHEHPEYTINLHLQVHHDKRYKIHRYTELLIDFLFEMFIFCVLPIVLQYYSGVWICSPSVIFMISLTMTLGHIYNYSILGSNKIHQTHHRDTTVHFGPDFMDHLFGTAVHDHEDGTIHIPPILMATSIVMMSKLQFGWSDLC